MKKILCTILPFCAAAQVVRGNPMPVYYTSSTAITDNLAKVLYYYLGAAFIETVVAYGFLYKYEVDFGKLISLVWITNLFTYLLVQFYGMGVRLDDVWTVLQIELIPLLFEFLVFFVFLRSELGKVAQSKRALLLSSLVLCANFGSFSLSFLE